MGREIFRLFAGQGSAQISLSASGLWRNQVGPVRTIKVQPSGQAQVWEVEAREMQMKIEI